MQQTIEVLVVLADFPPIATVRKGRFLQYRNVYLLVTGCSSFVQMMSECNYGMGMDSGPTVPTLGGETRTNLIINYLPQALTDQEFYKIFVVIGPIKNCRIMKDLKVIIVASHNFMQYTRNFDKMV